MYIDKDNVANSIDNEAIIQDGSVRTYVNHVKNICHLKLAYPLTKRTLLVIG